MIDTNRESLGNICRNLVGIALEDLAKERLGVPASLEEEPETQLADFLVGPDWVRDVLDALPEDRRSELGNT